MLLESQVLLYFDNVLLSFDNVMEMLKAKRKVKFWSSVPVYFILEMGPQNMYTAQVLMSNSC